MKQIIFSKAKAVIVFKTVGMPVLRIFPGYNYVESESINKYFESSPAAKAQKENFLSTISGEIGGVQAEEAATAAAKNAELNKAQRVIKGNAIQMDKDKKLLEDQAGIIAKLTARLDALESKGSNKKRG